MILSEITLTCEYETKINLENKDDSLIEYLYDSCSMMIHAVFDDSCICISVLLLINSDVNNIQYIYYILYTYCSIFYTVSSLNNEK